MRVAHLHPALAKLPPNGAVVDAKVYTDFGQRQPCSIEHGCFDYLVICESLIADLHAGFSKQFDGTALADAIGGREGCRGLARFVAFDDLRYGVGLQPLAELNGRWRAGRDGNETNDSAAV